MAISPMDRRSFLQTSTAVAVAAAMSPAELVAAADPDPYGGFKMSVQSFSLRGFDVETALKHSQTLGLKYWEAYSKHIPLGTIPSHIDKYKKLLADADINLIAYGVLHFDENETGARQAFDFAKAMGIKSISANPQKNKATFDLLDKLVDEYKIAIAIHNHGPQSLYDRISDTEELVKDRHPLIGACVDTGHYLRSDEDPVEALERLGKRVHGVHLKDGKRIKSRKKSDKHMTILGEGDLDLVGALKVLKKLNFQNGMSLEYEENKNNPLSDIGVCLQNVREAVKKIG